MAVLTTTRLCVTDGAGLDIVMREVDGVDVPDRWCVITPLKLGIYVATHPDLLEQVVDTLMDERACNTPAATPKPQQCRAETGPREQQRATMVILRRA